MATIEPEHAEALYDALSDNGHEEPIGHGLVVGPWILIGSSATEDGRWHQRFYLIVGDEAGDTWGLRYGIGLTEEQEDDLPWEDACGCPLPLVRLYAQEVTRIEWRERPA